MQINPENLGNELRYLFRKYYILEEVSIDFNDSELYNEVLGVFIFDYNRYFSDSIIIKEKLYSRLELVGILLYRIATSYFLRNQESIAAHFSNLGRIISGFEIYFSAQIGKGIKINHGLGTVIGARCKIGSNVLIHQNVTLGDKNGGRPVLMDHVSVYAGAKILGNVICQNNSIIAANCVCMIDVPENSVIAGIPGKIKNK